MIFLIRTKALFFDTKNEWNIIKNEETSYSKIIKTFLIFIIIFRIIVSSVEMYIIGPYKGMNEISSQFLIISIYSLWLLYIYISALILNFLAPMFGAEKNRLNAIKIAAYCSVTIFISIILELFPVKYLGVLSIGYLIFLRYQGLKIVMGSTKNTFLYALFPEIILITLPIIIALVGYIIVSFVLNPGL